MKHPRHIAGYVEDASERFARDADEYHLFYHVVCKCGDDRFLVFQSEKPALKVRCAVCRAEVVVYDTGRYPSASKSRSPDQFHQVVRSEQGDRFRVYVMYEYGQLDDGEEFDSNDITWCQVFIEDERGGLSMILDDETA